MPACTCSNTVRYVPHRDGSPATSVSRLAWRGIPAAPAAPQLGEAFVVSALVPEQAAIRTRSLSLPPPRDIGRSGHSAQKTAGRPRPNPGGKETRGRHRALRLCLASGSSVARPESASGFVEGAVRATTSMARFSNVANRIDLSRLGEGIRPNTAIGVVPKLRSPLYGAVLRPGRSVGATSRSDWHGCRTIARMDDALSQRWGHDAAGDPPHRGQGSR